MSHRRLNDLRAAVADYEAEFGEIRAEEMDAVKRADRRDAVIVRGGVVKRGSQPGTAQTA